MLAQLRPWLPAAAALALVLNVVMAQGPLPPAESGPLARVWVHPTDGADPLLTDEHAYVNDPSLKFKTLQAAIDALQRHLAANYEKDENPDEQGLVIALPGLYGPHGAALSSNESLPIVMRDRVHVRGVGARRCVIRGVGQPNTPSLFWPDCTNGTYGTGCSTSSREVLVTFSHSTVLGHLPGSTTPPPWFVPSIEYWQRENVAEALDGFTFEGGELQVLFNVATVQPGMWPAGRVSHCVFDMRDGWEALPGVPASTVNGPWIGILMARRANTFTGSQYTGYLDAPTLIANNTFVFAEWRGTATTGTWIVQSLPEAVGIIDVTNPNCGSYPGDPDARLRGVGNPCIVGNLFRTAPSSAPVRPFAMLGIDDPDTRVWDGISYVQTNAFDPARVGSTNGHFWSRPVASMVVESGSQNSGNTLWNCQQSSNSNTGCGQQPSPCALTSPPGPPAAHIWDGSTPTSVDPGFVGEYIASGATPGSATEHYRDWRLLPGSPLEDRGAWGVQVNSAAPRKYLTQVSFPPPPYQNEGLEFLQRPLRDAELDLLTWDGEHWGNPGVVGAAPDIGFDERHLLICAGSWSNDSNSHNQPGFLHPGLAAGSPKRVFILPESAGGIQLNAGSPSLTIYLTELVPTGTSAGDGWIAPPLALASPPSLASLPVDFRTKYIAFGSTPAPWTKPLGLSARASWDHGPKPFYSFPFVVAEFVDDECSGGPTCKHAYFNMQGVVEVGGVVALRSNMQGEYR